MSTITVNNDGTIDVVTVGTPGAAGAGVTPGGSAGQFLAKASGTDYDTEWVTASGIGDLLSTNNLSDLANAATALTNLGLTATAAELNYTDGVTSAIQTQLDAKASSSHTHTASDITDFDTEVSNNASVTANTAKISYTDAAKVAGIEAGATADQTGAEIKSLYEAEADTNAFTDAEKTKLSGVETSADVTDVVNVGSSIHGATAKTTPIDADTIPFIDSAASNVLKKVTWANVKATIKTYFDTIYAAVSHTHNHTEITDYDTELAGTTNTTAFTPTSDYHPATKKYVDDAVTAGGGYTDEQAQDAVGGILTDSSEIDFTYDDVANSITAALVAGSIDETKLDTSVNASLDLADSALQSSDIGSTVQAHSSVLDATTASFTTADETKLDGIEAGADVTDTANVTAAGALMDSEVTNLAQVKSFDSSNYATAAQGALADSALQSADIGTSVQAYDVDTAKTDVAQEFTATQNFNATTLTDGATINWDLSANQVTSVTLGGNRTLAAPTNLKDGATYILTIKQDATGSRTLTFNSAYKFPGGTAPTLTTSANAVDIITFVSDGTSLFGVSQLNFS